MPVGAREVPLAHLLRGFSYALDLTQGISRGHAIRTAFLSLHLAEKSGLSPVDQADVFFAAYIKDSGCPAAVDVIRELVDSNDVLIHRAKHLHRGSILDGLKIGFAGLRPGRSLPVRLLTLPVDLARLGRHNGPAAQLRCIIGRSIAERLGLSQAVQAALSNITELYDGSGLPNGLQGEDISLPSRIIAVAQLTDAYSCVRSEEEAKGELRRRSGKHLDPHLADLQLGLLEDAEFVAELADPRIGDTISRLDPLGSIFQGDRARIRDIATAFGEVVDIKSPYTGTHSVGTAAAAVAIGGSLGLEADLIWNLELAALLHDLGKLSVPTNLLNKKADLNSEDWIIIQSHPEFTRAALIQTDLFEPVADLAASHHERLDGAGYPHSMKAEDLTIGDRILAVADVYDALSGDRPYRDPLTRQEVVKIMDGMVGDHLDGDAVAALRRSI